MLIATSTAMYDRHTHSFEAERSIALRPSRNLQIRCLAIYRRHFNLVAEGCLRKADRQFIENVVSLPFEELVRLYCQNNIQITRCSATGADFTLASDTYINAIVYSGGDIDHHAAVITHPALAPAFLTGRSDDTPLASAAFAHRDVDELAKNGLLYTTYLAGALTY